MRPHRQVLRAVSERQSRVYWLLAGQPPAFVDAVDEHLAQHSVSATLRTRGVRRPGSGRRLAASAGESGPHACVGTIRAEQPRRGLRQSALHSFAGDDVS